MFRNLIQREQASIRDKPTPALAWHRGLQSGVFEVYLFIRRKHPQAARAILDEFKMNGRNGNIKIS